MAPSVSEDIQLVKELKLAQDEKADALRKVARLKEQIQQLQNPQQPAMTPHQQQSVSQVRNAQYDDNDAAGTLIVCNSSTVPSLA
jgi:hypothetical protein